MSSKSSYGHAESSLDNIAEDFLRWERNSFAQDPKLMKDKLFLTEKLWYFNMFLWLRRLRFWQSSWVYSDWPGFISTQCSSIIKTKMFSRRTTFAWFVPKDIYIAFLTTPSETFQKQSSRSFTCCLELMKSIYFKLICLCSKISIGHGECSFGNTAEVYLTGNRIFFVQSKQEKHINIYIYIFN